MVKQPHEISLVFKYKISGTFHGNVNHPSILKVFEKLKFSRGPIYSVYMKTYGIYNDFFSTF